MGLDWQQIPLWIAGLVLAWLALRRLLLMELLLRQRFEAGRLLIRPQERFPSSVREVLDFAAPALTQLGFQPRHGQVIWNGMVAMRHRPMFAAIYCHPELRCHAAVLPADEPEPGALYNVEFLTCYADGRQLGTLNRRLHTIPALPPDWLVEDVYAPTLEAQWERHRSRMQAMGDATIVNDPAEVLRRSQKLQSAFLPHLRSLGMVCPARQAGLWRFTVAGAWRFMNQLFAGARRAGLARPAAGGEPTRVQALADAFAYSRSAATRENAPSHWLAKLALFGGSAVLGAVAFGMALSWEILPALLGVLLFHELGHLAAMRLSGYRDLNVFFIPFLGAAVSGRKDDATPWQRLFVYLAGPLPGLVLGAVCLYLAVDADPAWSGWLFLVGLLALVLNFLNLLPFLPLDGGRIVEALLFARLPRLRFAFLALSAALLATAGAYATDAVLVVVGGLILLTLPAELRLMRLMDWLKRRRAELGDPKQTVRNLFAALAHSGGAARLSFAQRAQTVRSLLPLAAQRAPRALESVAGMSLYAAVLAVPVAMIVVVDPATYLGQLAVLAAQARQELVAPTPAAPPRDWEADLAQAADSSARWQILFDAGRWHEDGEDMERARGYFQRALDQASGFAPDDLRAADTRIALARSTEDPARATELYNAAMAGLGSAQGADRLRIADVLEALHHLKADAPPEARVARLQHALAIRESLPEEQPDKQRLTRRELARLLDSTGDLPGAESLLRQNLDQEEQAPAATGAEFRHSRLDLAWFLIAHGRASEAESLLQPVAGGDAAGVAADRLRIAMAWSQMEQGKLDDAAAAFQDLLERRDFSKNPASRGVFRLELLFDLALVAQRRGDAAVQETWLTEARKLLATLPEAVAAAVRTQRYPDLAAAAADWQALRWQRYGQIAAAL